MKDGTYSNNVQNFSNSDLFGSNFTDEQNDQDIVYKSRTDNESNMTYDFPAQYMTQSTTLTNYCLCTCCHKTDIPRSQCIIFKESKYNYQLSIIQPILDSYFEGIDLQKIWQTSISRKMPTNSVASKMRLTSHKPQQKCIHCNSVPTDKFLTFDKTKYGENSIVSQNDRKWWTKDYM